MRRIPGQFNGWITGLLAQITGFSLKIVGNNTADRVLNVPDGDVTLTTGTSIAGSIANTQVAVGSGTNTIAGSAALTFTASILGITGSVNSAQGSITTAVPNISGTATWNNAGIAFTGWQLNVTDTASTVGSKLLDLQIAGLSKFFVLKSGNISCGATNTRVDGASLTSVVNCSNDTAAAADIGPGFLWRGDTGDVTMGAVYSGWNGAANTDAYLALYTRTASVLTEKMRIASTGQVSIASTTDSTTTANGSIITAGGMAAIKNIRGGALIVSSGPTSGVGYATGAGGTVTQITSRATGVTLSKVSGQITLFTAAGSATPATFVVTNTAVAATDTITINDVSGSTNVYWWKATPAAGSFTVTFWTTGGTASDTPIINFTVMKGVTS